MKPSSIAVTLAAAAALLCAPLAARPLDTTPQAGAAPQAEAKGPGITEDQVRARLTNKLLFLRGFYMDNDLNFNENGGVIGSPSTGSFTLCAIEIKKVRLTKHKLELEGDRYGLHFYGALPYEDDNKPYDRVRLTTKRALHISIDRELVVIPKAKKEKKGDVKQAAKTAPTGASSDEAEATAEQASLKTASAAPAAVDPNAVTTTASPAHSAKLLSQAIDNIFAERIDDRMMARLPDYWQFYFHEKVLKHGFKPSDPGVLRLDADMKPPKVLNSLEPGSNEYAQKNNIAGITLFRTVVDAQGRPTEIAIARPIGFGLDEKAVEAIRRSHFTPAIKDGKPVPVVVDLVVTFRIFSNRTRGTAIEGAAKPVAEALTKPPSNQGTN